MPELTSAACVQAPSPVRVVVVDDEPGLVALLTQSLDLLGWQVIGFTSPGLALELLHREKQHLLVTDLMMPDLDGLQLARAAKAAQPELKVLLVSGAGHSFRPEFLEGNLRHADAFLAKPMHLEALSQCCQRLLAQGS